MRPLVATLLALSIALPARAADAWRDAGFAGTGPTWTDLDYYPCSSTTTAFANYGATSRTNALKLVVWSGTTPTITTFDAPAPAVSSYGHMRGLHCTSSRLMVAGGGLNYGTGIWVAYRPLPYNAADSWTLTIDVAGTPYRTYAGHISLTPPGVETYIGTLFYRASTFSPTAIFAYQFNTPSTTESYEAFGSIPDFIGYSDSCAGQEVSSSYYFSTCVGNGRLYWIVADGTPSTPVATGIEFGGGGPSGGVRPEFAYNGTIGIATYYYNPKTYIVAVNGSGTVSISSTLDSTNLVPGTDWSPGGTQTAWWWSTAGDAWCGEDNTPSSVSNTNAPCNNATYDITCDSGSVTAVFNPGVDLDGSGSSTNDRLALCSSGNAQYWGAALGGSVVTRPRRSSLSGSLRGSLGRSL